MLRSRSNRWRTYAWSRNSLAGDLRGPDGESIGDLLWLEWPTAHDGSWAKRAEIVTYSEIVDARVKIHRQQATLRRGRRL